MNQTKAHYKSRIHAIKRRILSAVLIAVLVLSVFPMPGNMAWADSDGMIRVKLTSLGSSVTSITMTTVGTYTAGGKTIPSGSTVKVAKSGSTLKLTVGGSQIDSGTKLTMSRTSGGVGSGVRFTSPSLSNLFCGDLTFSISGSSIQTVLSIYIETYLYGVVPYEMSNGFPLEALKAQTIAARTYAMRAKKSSGSYDVTDNTSSQVFKGYNSAYNNAIAAVDGTRGVVLMSGSAYAQCYYTASNGGQTESTKNAWGSSNISYLTVKDDPYDRENPNSIVKSYAIPKKPQEKAINSQLKAALIAAAADQLKSKGLSSNAADVVIQEITSVEPHTPKYSTPSRTYTKLRFGMKLTSKSNSTKNEISTQVEVDLGTYSQLESMLSLSINSSDNEIIWIDETDTSFKLSFGRYGHGIGLSQRGAQWMADKYGMTYEQILDFYYPGTKQTRLSLNEIIVGGGTSPDPTPTRIPVESDDGYTTLQEGDSGEAVKKLQTRLKELGYFTGTPLGNYKTLTVTAVKAYQKAMGLEQNGIATPELQKMIFAQQQTTPAPTPAPTAAPAPEQKPSAGETYATVSLSSSSSKLNVRKSPSTSAAIAGTLKHGAKITVLSVSGEWRQITDGKITGYVMASYLKFIETEATDTPEIGIGYTTLQYGDSGEAVQALQEQLQKMGYFTGTPLGNYKTLTVAAVEAYQKAMGLKVDGIATPELQEMIFAGQMPAKTPAPTPDGGVSNTMTATVSLGSASSRLNVRKEASTSAAVVGTLKHGAKVTILSSSNGWSKIQTDNVTGYVKSSYLIASSGPLPTARPETTPAPEATAAPQQTASPSGGIAVIKLNSSSSKLNVRKGPSTSTSIVGTLKHNTQVEVLETSGSWSRIRSGSLTGYVMTSYLSQSVAPAPTSSPTQKPSTGNTTYKTLSYGDSGEAVKKLQTRLKELGYFDGALGGNYLKLTRAAVEAYQQANGWSVDGIATPELQKEIFEQTNAAANATVKVGADSYLNLRKTASSSAAVLARMKNGTRVYVSGSSGDWYKVQTASGLTGYAKKDYVEMD